ICAFMVEDGLAWGVRGFLADIELPAATMDTPSYEYLAQLGFRRSSQAVAKAGPRRRLLSRERRSGRAPRTSAGRRPGTLPVPGAPTGRGERRASAKPSFACSVPSRGFKPRAQPFGQGRVEHFGGSREHDEVPGFGDEDGALVGRSAEDAFLFLLALPRRDQLVVF